MRDLPARLPSSAGSRRHQDSRAHTLGLGLGCIPEREADVAREVSGALGRTLFLTSGLGDASGAAVGLGALCRGACEEGTPLLALRPGAVLCTPCEGEGRAHCVSGRGRTPYPRPQRVSAGDTGGSQGRPSRSCGHTSVLGVCAESLWTQAVWALERQAPGSPREAGAPSAASEGNVDRQTSGRPGMGTACVGRVSSRGWCGVFPLLLK